MQCSCGTTYKLTPNGFKYAGYVFTGWNTKADGSGITFLNEQTILNLTEIDQRSVILYAQWERAECTVSFYTKANGVQRLVDSKTLPYDLYFGRNMPEITDEGFVGWFTSDGKEYKSGMKVPQVRTLSLYAHYNTYKIIYDPNGGVGERNLNTFERGKELPLWMQTYSKDECYFGGWNTKADGSGKAFSDEETVKDIVPVDDHIIVLYAQWIPAYCTVYFYDDVRRGTQLVATKVLACDQHFGREIPRMSSNYFVGWFVANSGTEYTSDTLVPRQQTLILVARYRDDEEMFFRMNPRFKRTLELQEPRNSGVESAMSVTLDQYWDVYRERGPFFKAAYLEALENGTVSAVLGTATFFEFVEKNQKHYQDYKYDGNAVTDLAYLYSIPPRASIVLAGADTLIGTEAGQLLHHYLTGFGTKYNFDASSMVCDWRIGTAAFNYEANYLMDQMEYCLTEGQTITFTDRDASKNRLSFTNNTFSPDGVKHQYDFPIDIKFLDKDLNGFFAIKEGSYGLSGSCTYKDGYYEMDLNFYIQDCYDFYYKSSDRNSQAFYWALSCYVDELAYLVLIGGAHPFVANGVFRAKIRWCKNQNADLIQLFSPLPWNALSPFAEISKRSR